VSRRSSLFGLVACPGIGVVAAPALLHRPGPAGCCRIMMSRCRLGGVTPGHRGAPEAREARPAPSRGKQRGGFWLPGGFCAPWTPELSRKPRSSPLTCTYASRFAADGNWQCPRDWRGTARGRQAPAVPSGRMSKPVLQQPPMRDTFTTSRSAARPGPAPGPGRIPHARPAAAAAEPR
jgi:hypothetical protein